MWEWGLESANYAMAITYAFELTTHKGSTGFLVNHTGRLKNGVRLSETRPVGTCQWQQSNQDLFSIMVTIWIAECVSEFWAEMAHCNATTNANIFQNVMYVECASMRHRFVDFWVSPKWICVVSNLSVVQVDYEHVSRWQRQSATATANSVRVSVEAFSSEHWTFHR